MDAKGKHRLARRLRDLLCGILIGAAGILPGISGGVLAVVFDVYRPFMEIVSRPRRALPQYWGWFLPVAAGWVVGFLGFAKGIAAAMDVSETVTAWLFIGLILGTVPQLYREAGKQGRGSNAWLSCILCAAAVFAVLYRVSRVARVTVTPGFGWYLFCGVLWGVGVVIPGLTSSSVMMALGLYEPVMRGLAELDGGVLGGALPGMLVTILLLARAVTGLFARHYAVAFHGILGIVAASTLVIIPTEYAGVGEALLSALCCAVGALLAFAIARLDRRLKR